MILAVGLAASVLTTRAAPGTPVEHTAAAVPVEPVTADQRRPNFVEHIAPIVHIKCAPCHRPGAAAPFPLLSYDDVQARGKDVAAAVRARHMPPWRAASGSGFPPMRDDARLTDRQIATITDWVDAGMPSGDLTRATPPPPFPTGWRLGVPDLTLTLPRTISIPASNEDQRVNIAIYLNLPADHWITAIDYQPTARSAIDHVLFFSAPTSLVVDDEDALPGFGGLLGSGRMDNLGERMTMSGLAVEHVGTWVPGGLVRVAPEGLGPRLPARSNLIMQLHTRATDTGAVEDGRVAIYFSRSPVNRTLTPLQLPPAFGMVSGLNIPPDEPRYVLRDSFTLPADADAIGASGYAHLLAREMKLTARLPGGATRGLLWIDRWDVAWQDTYYFAAPIRLPKGTVIQSEIVYDNSTGNPRNPSAPPRRVAWGASMADEMGSVTLLLAARDESSTAALAAARAQHFQELLVRPIRR